MTITAAPAERAAIPEEATRVAALVAHLGGLSLPAVERARDLAAERAARPDLNPLTRALHLLTVAVAEQELNARGW